MRKNARLETHALVLFLFFLMALFGCSKPEQTGESTPPTVEVTAVQKEDVPVYREWVGSLAGDVDATISAQISGYLLRRVYNEGQYVKKGDLLFEIDDRSYQAVLDQEMARLRKTEMDVKRYTPLAKTQAVSQQELDDAIQQNFAAQASVNAARLNVQFCKITSPVDGIAGIAQAQIGNLVGPGSGPLTTVVKIDPIRAYFSIAQDLLTQIQEHELAHGNRLRPSSGSYQGPELELILLSGKPYSQKGQVKFADNQIDVRTGTVRVCGVFPNSQALLVPGMFVRVRALLDVETNALVVPQRAVTDLQGSDLIAVVDSDNKVSIRKVTTGERFGENWVIKGNIKAGDHVVAEGVQKVRDGTLVNPVPFVPQSASASAAQAEREP